ncbi:hypothetical protein SAMN05216215_110714 [Saccharopolyspora shandongensis]|uniref:Uncharacterized protein n=1 Tax=Saccharopolyspora shandongensis TaxID=418495 RepID=A0A1H3U6T0_9PSEU|nr:hypothetical protein [Saccharopolyspora shandongensis]SDZ57239.1 hypothetical protein SAMN05216215_110714 [Saccharopolyspora shandongensis]
MSTPTRPAPPGLEIPCPPCSVCSEETNASPDRTFDCEHCECSWSTDNPEQPGEWWEPEAPQCRSTRKPYIHLTQLNPEIRDQVVRCLLHEGHGGKWHYAADIGWTGASA